MSSMKTLAFASAAHEFRNPLNAIINSLELLNPLINHKKGGDYYTSAKNSSNLMLYLVNDILDFSQFESKTLLLNIQRVSLKDLIQECMSILSF